MGQWRKAETGKQKHQRVLTSVPIRISTVDAERDPDTGKRFFRSTETTTANLSAAGPSCIPGSPWLPADVSSSPSHSRPAAKYRSWARVAWTRRELRPTGSQELQQPGYGIEFIAGSGAEVAALDAYLGTSAASTQSALVSRPPSTAPSPS